MDRRPPYMIHVLVGKSSLYVYLVIHLTLVLRLVRCPLIYNLVDNAQLKRESRVSGLCVGYLAYPLQYSAVLDFSLRGAVENCIL